MWSFLCPGHFFLSFSFCRSVLYFSKKRRIGKTRPIKEALQQKDKTAIYYECIKGTVKENVDAFVKVLLAEQVLPFASSFDTFQDVFTFLNSLSREFVVVIDEYPYLSTFVESQKIDSVFQSIVDTKLNNISLILSGSQISVMKNLLEEKDALYGRFGLIIHLQELNYREAAAFYPPRPLTKRLHSTVFSAARPSFFNSCAMRKHSKRTSSGRSWPPAIRSICTHPIFCSPVHQGMLWIPT